MNTCLRCAKPSVYCNRTIILKTIADKGIDEVRIRAIKNLNDLKILLEWNYSHGIFVYRMSSEMFPHLSNNKIIKYSLDFAKELLCEIGVLAKKLNQRLTFHPGQFNNLGSPRQEVVDKTITELQDHCHIMDLMDLDKNSVIVIHGGGVYGNKTDSINRFKTNFYKLNESTRNRLVLENCEKSYSTEDCLGICNSLNIPMVHDTHHYSCYSIYHPEIPQRPAEELIPEILDTWTRRGIKPKFHVSEQGPGRVGHHSDYIESIPEYLLSIPEKYSMNIDIMIEAKMKEQAIMRLREKYFPE
jgi:UV DNA damage endonuclease